MKHLREHEVRAFEEGHSVSAFNLPISLAGLTAAGLGSSHRRTRSVLGRLAVVLLAI